MARTRLSMQLRDEIVEKKPDSNPNRPQPERATYVAQQHDEYRSAHQTNDRVNSVDSTITNNVDLLKWAIFLVLVLYIFKMNGSIVPLNTEPQMEPNMISLFKQEINQLQTALNSMQTRFDNFSLWIESIQANRFINSRLTLERSVDTYRAKSLWNLFSTSNADLDHVKILIRQALYIYNADKTGMADFALESMGGSVLTSHCSASYSKNVPLLGFFSSSNFPNKPEITIKPNVLPGECWSFYGSHGVLVIKLSERIKPTQFSIEHIPKVLSPNGQIDSAPKDFTVYGHSIKYKKDGGTHLGSFKYDTVSIDYLQYFAVDKSIENEFSIIEFRIESNHGNKDYTCIYRVRVHGLVIS
jgi:hypothetical protein